MCCATQIHPRVKAIFQIFMEVSLTSLERQLDILVDLRFVVKWSNFDLKEDVWHSNLNSWSSIIYTKLAIEGTKLTDLERRIIWYINWPSIRWKMVVGWWKVVIFHFPAKFYISYEKLDKTCYPNMMDNFCYPSITMDKILQFSLNLLVWKFWIGLGDKWTRLINFNSCIIMTSHTRIYCEN